MAQSCLTLCDPTDGRLPGSSVHGILQAKILKWVAISFSRESSQPRDQTLVSCFASHFSCIGGRFFTIWATGKSLQAIVVSLFKLWLWLLFFLFYLWNMNISSGSFKLLIVFSWRSQLIHALSLPNNTQIFSSSTASFPNVFCYLYIFIICYIY